MDRFCFLAAPTFLYSSLYGYLGDILEKVNLIENLHPIVEIVIFLFPIFVAIALPPNLWCLLRYKKDSVMAIKHHYRQSIWKDAIPMWLLWMIPFLFHLLLFAIYVTKKNKLKEIMKAELKIEEEPLFFIISLWGDAKLILITVNELNRVWENYVKSKPFSDNRTP